MVAAPTYNNELQGVACEEVRYSEQRFCTALETISVLAGWTITGVVFTIIRHFCNQEVVHFEGPLDAEPVPVRATTRSWAAGWTRTAYGQAGAAER